MISALIVWGTVIGSGVFVAAWALSPALRTWIERPKYGFLDAVQEYDRAARDDGGRKEHPTP